MLDYRPHSGEVPRNKKHCFVMARNNFINDVHNPDSDEDPHKGEVPLLSSREPSPQRERAEPTSDRQRMELLRYLDQVVLRDFRAKARKRKKDLDSAGDQNGNRNGTDPMCDADDSRLFEDSDKRNEKMVLSLKQTFRQSVPSSMEWLM